MRTVLLVAVVAVGLGTSACIVDLGMFGKYDCNPKGFGTNHVDASAAVCVPLR